ARVLVAPGSEQRYKIDILVRLLVDALQARLPRKCHQWRMIEVCVSYPSEQVDGTRSQCPQADTRCPGQSTPDVCHKGSTLLVARGHELNALRRRQRLQHIHCLLTRNAKDIASALMLQATHQQVRRFHALCSRVSRLRWWILWAGSNRWMSVQVQSPSRLPQMAPRAAPAGSTANYGQG